MTAKKSIMLCDDAAQYARDGLVAWFDGKIGKSGTTWKNLAGTNKMSDMTLAGEFYFTESGVRLNESVHDAMSSTGIGRVQASGVQALKTIEAAISYYQPNGIYGQTPSAFPGYITFPITFPCLPLTTYHTEQAPWDQSYGASLALYTPSYDDSILDYPTTKQILQVPYSSFSTVGFAGGDGVKDHEFALLNGTMTSCSPTRSICTIPQQFTGTVEFFNRSTDFNRPLNALVNCIRIYDRVLSAEEVKLNHDADVKRYVEK